MGRSSAKASKSALTSAAVWYLESGSRATALSMIVLKSIGIFGLIFRGEAGEVVAIARMTSAVVPTW